MRKLGSGNIGATNVLRTGKSGRGGDASLRRGKGSVAVSLAQPLSRSRPFVAVAAVGAFLGHLFPVWLGFKGGKGVATFIGIVFALDWEVAFFTAASWLVVARATAIPRSRTLSAGLTPCLFAIYGETLWAALMRFSR